MISKNNFSSLDSFDKAEYFSAQTVFNAWQAQQAQDIDDYLLRQRKAELNALVKRVIEKELSESSKLLIDLRWNKNYSLEKIGKILGVDPSTVYRRLEKINDTLYEKLKYAIEYRFGGKNNKAYVIIKDEIKKACSDEKLSDCASRLKALRMKNQLSISDLSFCTKIDKNRLKKIEDGKTSIETDELISLALFFKVSTDYLLFGKFRVLRDPFTGLPIKCNC